MNSFVGLLLPLSKGWETLFFGVITDMMALNGTKRKILNFQLLSVAQERLSLSSLLTGEHITCLSEARRLDHSTCLRTIMGLTTVRVRLALCVELFTRRF